MALSEREQRLFDEIEESLARDDPQVCSASRLSVRRRRVGGLNGFAMCVIGLGLVLLGVVAAHAVGTIVAIIGFALTVLGCDACIGAVCRSLQKVGRAK